MGLQIKHTAKAGMKDTGGTGDPRSYQARTYSTSLTCVTFGVSLIESPAPSAAETLTTLVEGRTAGCKPCKQRQAVPGCRNRLRVREARFTFTALVRRLGREALARKEGEARDSLATGASRWMEQRTVATPFTGFLTKVGRDTLHDNIAFIVVNPLCDRNPALFGAFQLRVRVIQIYMRTESESKENELRDARINQGSVKFLSLAGVHQQ